MIKLKADTQVAAKIDVLAVAENFWWLSSISFYTKGDLSQLTVLNQNDVIFRGELVRVGLTLNLNKQMKKLDWNF